MDSCQLDVLRPESGLPYSRAEDNGVKGREENIGYTRTGGIRKAARRLLIILAFRASHRASRVLPTEGPGSQPVQGGQMQRFLMGKFVFFPPILLVFLAAFSILPVRLGAVGGVMAAYLVTSVINWTWG